MIPKIRNILVSATLIACIVAMSGAPALQAQTSPAGVGLQLSALTRAAYQSVKTTTTLSEIDYFLGAFMDAYGVPAYRTCPEHNIGECRSIAPSDLSPYRDTIAEFILEWSKYTPEFIEISGIEGVYFLMDLPYGGATFSNDNNFYINAAFGNQDSYPGYIQRVFHHEFFHLVDKKFPASSDDDWSALNTPGFTYIGGSGYDELPEKTDHPEPGFVHSYSMVSPDEDKAVLYEHLFFEPRTILLNGWASGDAYLTNKIQYMKNQLEALDSSMNDAYFTEMHDYDIDAELPPSVELIVGADQTSNALLVGENQTTTLNGRRGNTVVFANGTLKGSGQTGTLLVYGDGRVAPGASPGCMTTGALVLIPGSLFDIEIAGDTVCTEYDQLRVNGAVSLNGAILDVAFLDSFIPLIGSSYTILDNDGAEGIAGTFDGLPEGATVTAGDVTFRISYVGGSGNDITLTVLTAPDRPASSGGQTDGNAPSAPNTGIRPMLASPVFVLLTTVISSTLLFWMAKKFKMAPKA